MPFPAWVGVDTPDRPRCLILPSRQPAQKVHQCSLQSALIYPAVQIVEVNHIGIETLQRIFTGLTNGLRATINSAFTIRAFKHAALYIARKSSLRRWPTALASSFPRCYFKPIKSCGIQHVVAKIKRLLSSLMLCLHLEVFRMREKRSYIQGRSPARVSTTHSNHRRAPYSCSSCCSNACSKFQLLVDSLRPLGVWFAAQANRIEELTVDRSDAVVWNRDTFPEKSGSLCHRIDRRSDVDVGAFVTDVAEEGAKWTVVIECESDSVHSAPGWRFHVLPFMSIAMLSSGWIGLQRLNLWCRLLTGLYWKRSTVWQAWCHSRWSVQVRGSPFALVLVRRKK